MPEFTRDMFTSRIPLWTRMLGEYVGKPDIHYLEIGSFEGMSACWMRDRILTGKPSYITCVEPWLASDELPVDMAQVRRRFWENMEGWRPGADVFSSIDEMVHARGECEWPWFDIAYIDGSHHAADVLSDAVRVWPMVKLGGLVVFDDYNWERSKAESPAEDNSWDIPHTAIDAFGDCYLGRYEILAKEVGQIWLKKIR